MQFGRDEIGQRSETVRRANLSAIVRELHLRGPQTRSELVARTGLTRSAIRGLVGELVAGGLAVEEAPARLGTPGRPSPVVRLVADGAVVLALEIAVDSSGVAIVGLGGEILVQRRVDRPRGSSTLADVVHELVALADWARARRPAAERPIGVGVAVAGIVRRQDGRVAFGPNLGWLDEPLGARLQGGLGLDVPITPANEADLGAIAELRRGAGRGADDLLYVHGEVGIGGGIVVDGRPLDGIAGFAGEIGHMPINASGRDCRCGSIGCWETEIGEGALLARAGRDPDGGRVAVDELLDAADAGDAVALGALHETGIWIGIGLAGLVNVLNSRRILLGGLLGRIHPYVADDVERELDRRALPAPRRLVSVMPAGLGPDAPLVGAAEHAFEPLLADPASRLARTVLAELETA